MEEKIAEKNRVEKFKEWVQSNRLTAFIIIIGLIYLAGSKIIEATGKYKDFYKENTSADKVNYQETIIDDVNIVDSIIQSTDVFEKQILINSKIDDIKIKIDKLKETEKNSELILNQLIPHFRELKEKANWLIIESIKLYEESNFDDAHKSKIQFACIVSRKICLFEERTCTEEEQIAIIKTLEKLSTNE